MLVPLSMADSVYVLGPDASHESAQAGHVDSWLPCSEMTTETLESIQKSGQHRVLHEQQDGLPESSDKHPEYDFVIDHHKCDWIIRSSEPDP